jgi:ribulose-5-phosphate 4-epimerase/fuculose-1-phosphate aldolase
VLRLDGALIKGPRPSKEYPLHLAFYRRSTQTAAVVHVHSPYAAAASLLPAWRPHSALPPLTPYFVMRVGQAPLIPYAAPGDADQARLIERHEMAFRAVLLQNHGPVTSGRTVEEAVDATIELEEASRLAILTAGQRVNVLTAEQARSLAEQYGSPWEV